MSHQTQTPIEVDHLKFVLEHSTHDLIHSQLADPKTPIRITNQYPKQMNRQGSES